MAGGLAAAMVTGTTSGGVVCSSAGGFLLAACCGSVGPSAFFFCRGEGEAGQEKQRDTNVILIKTQPCIGYFLGKFERGGGEVFGIAGMSW